MTRHTDDATEEPTDAELFRCGDVFADECGSLTVVRDGTDASGKVKVKTDSGTTVRVSPRKLIERVTGDTEGSDR